METCLCVNHKLKRFASRRNFTQATSSFFFFPWLNNLGFKNSNRNISTIFIHVFLSTSFCFSHSNSPSYTKIFLLHYFFSFGKTNETVTCQSPVRPPCKTAEFTDPTPNIMRKRVPMNSATHFPNSVASVNFFSLQMEMVWGNL